MKLYNTLTRKAEKFTPLEDKAVKLYTCGPTVYNYYHIGNLRNAVFNDTLRRTLDVLGYDVRHVMNITDVGHLVSDADEGEDKLEKGAKREGKSVWDVAAHYTEAFKSDMSAMNILPPNAYHSEKYDDNYARATEFLDTQIEMIKLLLEKGYAYQASQAIYFDVSKLPDYGILTGQRLADKGTAVREEVVSDKEKRGPHDFAIWFFTVGHYADHEMRWPSPWGEGFPGWHLECSAIIHSVLGDPIDIHTGGVDHIGTHHPNEMAQTEGAFGHPLSNFWMHNEFVLVDGKKMSKSLGNTYTLKDIVAKGYDPLAYRLLCLQTHYRSELNFTWESLAAAQNRIRKWRALADLRFQPKPLKGDGWLKLKAGTAYRLVDKPEESRRLLISPLRHDLNAAESIMLLDRLSDDIQVLPDNAKFLKHFNDFLFFVDQLFGLHLVSSTDITPSQAGLINDRETVRQEKDWAKSDKLRAQLEKQGIDVRDTPHGPIWSRL